MTDRHRKFAVLTAFLALLVCAAVAIAATPKSGTYTGKTGQGYKVKVKVNDKGNIPDGGFVARWKAVCNGKDENGKHFTWGPDGSQNAGVLPIADDGSFEQSGKYTQNSGAYKGHMSAKLSGQFTSSTTAKGRFKIKINVTKNGDHVDTCKKAVSWHVSD